MITQQHRRGLDAVLLGHFDHRLGGEQRSACAAQRAVRHDVDPLFFAEVDNLLLRQGRVVLDLVDCGDDGCMGEELLEVAFGVLFVAMVKRVRGMGRKGGREGEGKLALETPMALVLPVARSVSICFHVSTWLWLWMMSRSPLGSLGKRSSLPGVCQLIFQERGQVNEQTHPQGSSTTANAVRTAISHPPGLPFTCLFSFPPSQSNTPQPHARRE